VIVIARPMSLAFPHPSCMAHDGALIGRESVAEGFVYILANDRLNVLYVGCTNDLRRRIYFHKKQLISGFTKKYNVHRLVYFETLPDLDTARRRERELKGINRARKEELINVVNPSWRDLFGELNSGHYSPEDTAAVTRRDPSLRSG
jgi:putative endonuclease